MSVMEAWRMAYVISCATKGAVIWNVTKIRYITIPVNNPALVCLKVLIVCYSLSLFSINCCMYHFVLFSNVK